MTKVGEMDGMFVVLKDPFDETNRRYRMRLHKGNFYTYEWKGTGWHLINTVVRNPDPSALDTTTYYAE